ncbi:MAG: stage V sporulation protein AC [Lachnospiraceae bacterium]
MIKEPSNEQYNEYVKQVTPTHSCMANCAKAFLIGGLICLLGEMISQFCQNSIGLGKTESAACVTISLVFLSVLFTGFNLYQKLAKFGGAGCLVPITGFANSVAAPAIEFQTEGQVFGIGVKIFTIAGPVILYGIFTSWCVGVIYWIVQML